MKTLLLAGLLAGCLSTLAAPTTFFFARGADSQKLDPADVDDGESVKVLANICEGLVRFKTGTAEIEPCLATSWTISADAKTYTFQLRQGVKFHDGTAFAANAALVTFHRQMDKNHPARPKTGTFAYWQSMYSMVESVTAPDASTVVFRLREPSAPFLANLAIFPAAIISPKFVNQQHPVGTGPFRFVEWLPNERIVLAANAGYWGGAPGVDQLVFKVVPDSATRLIQLQAGQIHALDGLDPVDLPVIRKDKTLKLIQAPGLNVSYLSINCEKIPDRQLRRAIAGAINKKDILATVYRGNATIARNPLPPALLGHNNDIPEQLPAVKPPPLKTPLRLEVMTNPRPYLPNPTRAAELIKADLVKAGIPCEIVPNEFGSHLSRTSRGEHELALLGWVGDNADTDNFLYVLLDKDTATIGSALNICFWKHDGYHDLMMAAKRETDAGKRAAIYRQAQEIIAAEVPMVPLAHSPAVAATRGDVNGLEFEVNGDLNFRRVKLR